MLYTLYQNRRRYKPMIIGYVVICLALFSGISVQAAYARAHMEKKMKIVLSQNSQTVENLDQPRKISGSKTLFADHLDFPVDNGFRHRTLGQLGFNSNFYADVEVHFEVLEDAVYVFNIFSDDGFRLMVDGKLVAEFVHGRPMSESDGSVKLKAGKHQMKIIYFQGYGQMGLKGFYSKDGSADGKKYFIGQDSPSVKFVPFA
jgi:hypothetical protein